MSSDPPLTYRDAGVDIDAGEALVEDIKSIVGPTMRPEVLGGIGGFGALMRLPQKYRKPVLVSGTDGVGTKLRLGIDSGRVGGLGIDLVGMCVNDVLVSGAEPLFFLDYYATGKLDRGLALQVVRGIAEGCRQAGAALVGGETAEMPGMYAAGDFDLAGFCVAVVEEDDIVDGRRLSPGDRLVALPSSGPHSNGYSLIRKVLERSGQPLETPLADTTLGDALLAPTRIYVKPVLDLLSRHPVHAMAHITGGGLTENLPRLFVAGCRPWIDTSSWSWPPVFGWLQSQGDIARDEMLRTFNCGVGFVVAVPETAVADTLALLRDHGERPWVIGGVEAGEGREVVFR